MTDDRAGDEFVKIAEIEVDSVGQTPSGFTLSGRGQDRADYRLGLSIEMPMDSKTRRVVAELLSQSELTLSRRGKPSLRGGSPRRRRSSVP